jgi:hypothetical protein
MANGLDAGCNNACLVRLTVCLDHLFLSKTGCSDNTIATTTMTATPLLTHTKKSPHCNTARA